MNDNAADERERERIDTRVYVRSRVARLSEFIKESGGGGASVM